MKNLLTFIFLTLIITGCFKMDCETTVAKRVINSNGDLQAIRVVIDCGATTTPGSAIRIIESSDTTDKGVHENTIVGATAATDLYWKSNDTLLISGVDTSAHDRKNIFPLSKRTGKIVIVYRE